MAWRGTGAISTRRQIRIRRAGTCCVSGLVDYLAEVWLNGVKVGGHEGGEGVFVLDVTHAIKPGKNRLAVRVLNPTNEPIDGIALADHSAPLQSDPVHAGALYNDGGIVDSVELLLAPAVYLTDLHLLPDPKTGMIRVRATVRNTLPHARPRPTGRLPSRRPPAAKPCKPSSWIANCRRAIR